MQQTCPQCGSSSNWSSRFCTNCGATLEAPQRIRQSWEAPPSAYSTQVPPWAQTQGGMYQQQTGMGGPQANGSLGFGGQSDAMVRKLLFIVGGVILGSLLLMLGSIALAIVTPSPISTFFWVVALLIFVTGWITYSRIRSIIRRTVGSFWRFF